ncbi:MAG: PAS domain-containing protein [Bryobacterales bacterium]
MNLIPGDVGRPVSDINLKIDVPNLAEKVEEVVDSFTPLETEVRDSSGRWYSMRVRPYKTEDNRIDGPFWRLSTSTRPNAAARHCPNPREDGANWSRKRRTSFWRPRR